MSEGLPLAVTISLAYSTKKMLIDNNFVRHLAACETMGNATTICSDKTGTLTTNKMSVPKYQLYANEEYCNGLPTKNDIQLSAYQRISVAVCANTKSFQDEPKSDAERKAITAGKQKPPSTGGNQTDCAILQWIIDLGAVNYKEIREKNPITKVFPFDSKVKRSSVLVCETIGNKNNKNNDNKFVMYVKGAAEQILSLCEYKMNKTGTIDELTDLDRNNILSAMNAMTCTGLRCLGGCYRIYLGSEIPFKSLVGAFYQPWQNPLTAVQLWVNLIMDTMAALALSNEHPTRALLDRHPFKKDSHLITKILWRFIFGIVFIN